MAIAGGTNVLTNPDMTTGLDKGHFLSSTGNCKTFDETADGYCRGEGVATVILKRLEDALEDADPIYGMIDSAFTNHSAEAESITRPHVGAQKDIFERVLSSSGTDPYEVGYIEMHGTGTQAGDLREMTSVCDSFAPTGKTHSRPADRPLHVGALKANIGHGESVSGVSALIKTMMMLRKGEIPPHCGIKTRINPKLPSDLHERNIHIDLAPVKWPRSHGLPRKAIINNFSAAGGNTCLLVEEAPGRSAASVDHDERRPLYPVTVSARCAKSLEANVQALIAYLSARDIALPALSYTTTVRRIQHQHRITVASETISGLKEQLSQALSDASGQRRITPPKEMLFSFTGQGSQYPGMGAQLMQSLGAFRDQILHFNQLSQRLGFPAFLPLLHASHGDDIASYPPDVVQLANTCIQIALARIWISWGVSPTAVVGHSLGEYAALNIAGVLTDSDTLYLVGTRAQLLQELCSPGTHAMLAVAASAEDLTAVVPGAAFEIACINGPKETVLAGPKQQVLELKQTIAAAGIRTTLLQVPFAFHSSQVEPILAAFRSVAEGVTFRNPSVPVLSPLLGSVVRNAGVFTPEYLVRHARESVQMMACLRSASFEGVLTDRAYGIEFGPHPVVSGMIKSTLGSGVTILPTLRNKNDPWSTLTQSLTSLHQIGVPIRWDGYFADLHSARSVLELPAYKWELQSYWIKYRNDWTLTKGDIPIGDQRADPATTAPHTAHADEHSQRKLTNVPATSESTSIHKIVEEQTSSDGFRMTVECDTSRADIRPFVASHTVDGYGLCTPAVYADISCSIAKYVLDCVQLPFTENVATVANMDIKRALIGSADWKQLLRCSAVFKWSSKSGEISFTVHDEHGTEVGVLATCQIRFVDGFDRRRLATDLPVIKSRFDRMRTECGVGRVSRFTGSMAYRLVSTLADFNPDYHCIDEVLYDNDAYEAACQVSFGQMKKGGSFFINPGVVDGLTQSAGFVMNVNERTKLETDVFVNHGWKEFQLFEKIEDDCQYSTHVRMTATGVDELWTGDITIFTGDRLVALVKGVQIQGVKRRYLKFILSNAAKPPKIKTKIDGHQAQPAPQAAIKAHSERSGVVHHSLADSATAEGASSPSCNTQMTKALGIISRESGVPLSALHDDVRFEDIGIDSLLSLMIISHFAEELGINADTTFFMHNSTVGEFKNSFDSSASSIGMSMPQPAVTEKAMVPSEAHQDSVEVEFDGLDGPSINRDALADAPFDKVLKVISEETRVPIAQLYDEASLPDLGVDSLLALMIGSRLRDELDIDFDTHAMLTTLDTIGKLRQAMSVDHSSESSESGFSSDATSGVLVEKDISTPPSELDEPATEETVPPTSSVVLQGNSRTTSAVLFLFPDGSGLASSYTSLPRIRDDLVVYGLNSPYLKKGPKMHCSWDAMVGSYLAEIKRRQPCGPYSFAGWSAGGILAYHASQTLMRGGDFVKDLILLDSPPPFRLKLLPEHFFDYASTSGLLGGNGKAPDWLINHFRSINRVLYSYSATPLTVSTLRKVNILWACESSVDESFYARSDDPEDMSFLTVKRTDYSAGKWTLLFPKTPVQVDLAHGQHHWSLLKGDSVAQVAAYIRNVLA